MSPAGSSKDRRKPPERVGSVVDAILDDLGIADKVERARAAAEWEELVGPHIARVAGRARVHGRTLFVEVESAAWISELNMMRRHLLKKLNAGKTQARIEKIVFVQADGSRPGSMRGSDG